MTIYLNDQAVRVEAGISVAAALAIHGSAVTRYSVTGTARAPLCGMGVCQECRTTINGMQHQLACQTPCVEGMRVERCEVAQ
ncbi:(2Fe-2S)-binding protein [Pseudoduganella danionis]|uniref:(2Fe-2S)-binding protein n=1 Tax=Pseudoduganella danionis TaxID=1890295 RepID=A0ABW9SLQ7_9BURK|nr:(2Fe-2S)-binding protein [Pseudoduganella danionis]